MTNNRDVGRDIGLSSDREHELITLVRSTAAGEIDISPGDFMVGISKDNQFTDTDRVFLSFLVGGHTEGTTPEVWSKIGVSKKRENDLKQGIKHHFKGKTYISTIEFMQYILSEPGLSTGDRMYLGFICGDTYEPSKGFSGT
jgi:hypothetical protein